MSWLRDGATPYGGLVQGVDGNFYGMTSSGGASDLGTVFEITLTGTLTTLHSFGGATTGNVTILEPDGNPVTPQVFKVVPSASKFAPPSGPVGTQVVITGMSLTQTTSVSFGGVKATSFTVNSDTQVTATVPTGAKTGKVAIVTKGSSASAPGKFTVS